MNVSGQMPNGPHSREGSLYNFGTDQASISTISNPVTPLDQQPILSSSAGIHGFTPNHTSSLSSSFASNFAGQPPNMPISTTPSEPPPSSWMFPSPSGSSHPQWPSWGTEQVHASSNWMNGAGQGGSKDGLNMDTIDPMVFDAIAELIQQQGTNKPGQEFTSNSEQNPNTFWQSMSGAATGPVQSQSSLLTRRLQQQQSHQSLNTQFPPFQPTQVPGNSLLTQNSTQAFSGTPQSVTPTPKSFLGDPNVIASAFSSPSHFSPSTTASTSKAPRTGPVSPWSGQERVGGFTETPVTTPGGSEYDRSGMNSPFEVSHTSCILPPKYMLNLKQPQGPRMGQMPPPQGPVRRETFQNPGSGFSSPAPTSVPAMGRSSLSNPPSRQQSGDSGPTMEVPVQAPAANLPQVGQLPPLPPGLAIEQLAQYGSAGLEMAIRMGMGIGMSLGQQVQTQRGLASPAHLGGTTSVPTMSSGTPSSGQATSPETSTSRRETVKLNNLVTDILNDQFFPSRQSTSAIDILNLPADAFHPVSPRGAQAEPGSPEIKEPMSPEEAAKKDPLATQIWKHYAKGRETLPNGPRMENLTWRMMHLTLRKQEELAAAQAIKEEQEQGEVGELPHELERRGRSKGKAKIVGFSEGRQASPDPEWVPSACLVFHPD